MNQPFQKSKICLNVDLKRKQKCVKCSCLCLYETSIGLYPSPFFKCKQYSNWLNCNGQKAKSLTKAILELLRLSKAGLKRAIGLLTRRCCFKRHVLVVDDLTCRGCPGKEETALHILCECDYFSAYIFLAP